MPNSKWMRTNSPLCIFYLHLIWQIDSNCRNTYIAIVRAHRKSCRSFENYHRLLIESPHHHSFEYFRHVSHSKCLYQITIWVQTNSNEPHFSLIIWFLIVKVQLWFNANIGLQLIIFPSQMWCIIWMWVQRLHVIRLTELRFFPFTKSSCCIHTNY